MGMFSFLKAEKPVKEETAKKEKVGAASGQSSSNVMAQGFQNVPHDDTFKAYIPGFLYKPPFGYPLNKNVVQLKNLAKNAYVFSVIRTLKDEAATTKWEIKVKKEFASEDQEGVFAGNYDEDVKRISAWFYNPNGNEESFNDILAQWITDLCEVDAAVGVKVFNKKGDFSQLYARDGGTFLKNCDIYGYMGNRAEFVEPNDDVAYISVMPGMPSWTDKLNSYSMQYAAQAAYFQYGWSGVGLPVPFGRREIIYIAANGRSDNIYGRSPLEILYDTLLTLIYGQQYNLDFYLNGNTPDGLLHLAGADQEIAEAMQQRMANKFRVKDGLENERRIGHRYPVYGGPEANFIPFNLSAKDMEIIEQQKWFTKLVWSAFGVTPDEMGYTEDSNKAVSQTQTGVHKRKALKPLLKKIEYAINSQLMPELDSTGKFEFAFEDYDVDEEMKKYTLYEKQIQIGVKTPEMVAEEEGINLAMLQTYKTDAMQQEQNNQLQLQDNQSMNKQQEKPQGLKAWTRPANWIPWGKKQVPMGYKLVHGPKGGNYVMKTDPNAPDIEGEENDTHQKESDMSKPSFDNTSTEELDKIEIPKDYEKILTRFERAEPGKGSEVTFNSALELKTVLEKGHYALISAGRSPYDSKQMPESEIKKRYEKLKSDLIDKGYMFTKSMGKYGSDTEDSFLVMTHNPDEADMAEIGNKYNQESFIVTKAKHNEMIYLQGPNKGKKRVGDGFEIISKDAEEGYTEIKTGEQSNRFSSLFDWSDENLVDVEDKSKYFGFLSEVDKEKIGKYKDLADSNKDTENEYMENGVYNADRRKLHAKILSKYKKALYQAKAHNGKPKIVFLAGLTASGKSRAVARIFSEPEKAHDTMRTDTEGNKYIYLNADNIKEMLPEYDKGFGAAYVHEESSTLVKKLLKEAQNRKVNIIFDGTLSNEDSSYKKFEQSKKKGYETRLIHVTNTTQNAMENAKKRFKSSGRYTPLENIERAATGLDKTIERLKNEVDKYEGIEGGSR
jgi:phage portal protein BeeE